MPASPTPSVAARRPAVHASLPSVPSPSSGRRSAAPPPIRVADPDSIELSLRPSSAASSPTAWTDHTPMARRTSKPDSPPDKANGSGNSHAAAMAGLEQRRKRGSVDSPSAASAAAALMDRRSFSLDDDVPSDPKASSAGFLDLPRRDQRNFLLLVLLYFLQGIPMGLAMDSVPFLLKSHVSYSEIGVFSLASYPYSLKLLWSPIVDAVWTPRIGRRKSWILPIQTVSGFAMVWLSSSVEAMMAEAGSAPGAIWGFTWWWFALVFLCATQDIAVDGTRAPLDCVGATIADGPGWALTLLSQENLAYASTAQTVGLTGGQFLSYTIFLAFNSKDFANKWFRPANAPQDVGLITLSSYLRFWGWAYLAVTLGLAAWKREERTKDSESVWGVYKVMGGILKLRNIQTFIVVHLIAKIGFQANDAVTNLKLLDKGFSQEDLALTVLIDFPFEMGLGYYIGKWCQKYPPMHIWCWAFVGRLVAAVFAQFTVAMFPAQGTTTGYLLLVIVEHVYSTFMNTIMFVAVSAFHAKIADPVIGGTYMTLLAT